MSSEANSVPFITFQNGEKIPVIGLGTWRLQRKASDVVRDAIDIGYRHIDCAHSYENENEIGETFKELLENEVIKREDLFVTSKLWNTFHRPSLVREACEGTLRKLNLTYLDNYLVHWPMAYKEGEERIPKDENGKIIFSNVDFVDTWRAMEDLVDAGLTRSIGISNFNISQINRILDMARIPPCNLQIECHPYLNQEELMEFCKTHNIAVTGYSPLGSPSTPYTKPGSCPILQNPTVLSLAEKYKRTPAQILLRYQLDRGNIVIPRSSNKDRMKENISIFDFTLSSDDIKTLNSLDFGGRYMIMPGSEEHPHFPFNKQ